MEFSLRFDEADFERQLLDAMRGKAEDHVLGVAEEVRRSMGADGAGLRLEYVQADDGAIESLGHLKVTGPDAACKAFESQLRQRMAR